MPTSVDNRQTGVLSVANYYNAAVSEFLFDWRHLPNENRTNPA